MLRFLRNIASTARSYKKRPSREQPKPRAKKIGQYSGDDLTAERLKIRVIRVIRDLRRTRPNATCIQTTNNEGTA